MDSAFPSPVVNAGSSPAGAGGSSQPTIELYHDDMKLRLPRAGPLTDLTPEIKAMVQVLLVTVGDDDWMAVFRKMTPLQEQGKVIKVKPDKDSYMVGLFGVYCAAVVQSSRGSHSMQSVVGDAIRFLAPKAVILIGTGFGLRPQSQHLGDVMVSQQLATYNLQRIGEKESTNLGVVTEGGVYLCPLFMTTGVYDWEFGSSQIHTGVMVSGSKDINNGAYAKKLSDRYPQAVGGEMEGDGLYSACRAHNTQQWIVVKGISNFAGLPGASSARNAKKFAAAAATSIVFHVLSDHNLSGLGCTLPEQQGPRSNTSVPVQVEIKDVDAKLKDYLAKKDWSDLLPILTAHGVKHLDDLVYIVMEDYVKMDVPIQRAQVLTNELSFLSSPVSKRLQTADMGDVEICKKLYKSNYRSLEEAMGLNEMVLGLLEINEEDTERLLSLFTKDRKYSIFISHSNAAAPGASELLNGLLTKQLKGIQIFYSAAGIRDTSKVKKNVEQSKAVLLLLSKEYFRNPSCVLVLVKAHIENIPVCPCIVEQDFEIGMLSNPEELWEQLESVGKYTGEEFLRQAGVRFEQFRVAMANLERIDFQEFYVGGGNKDAQLRQIKSIVKAVKECHVQFAKRQKREAN